MAIYTLAELEVEIPKWKIALSALNHQSRVVVDGKEVWARDIDKVREHLLWLSQQRDQLLSNPTPAPAVGRTYAVNGRGR